jgi:hypothetical protein
LQDLFVAVQDAIAQFLIFLSKQPLTPFFSIGAGNENVDELSHKHPGKHKTAASDGISHLSDSQVVRSIN